MRTLDVATIATSRNENTVQDNKNIPIYLFAMEMTFLVAKNTETLWIWIALPWNAAKLKRTGVEAYSTKRNLWSPKLDVYKFSTILYYSYTSLSTTVEGLNL